MTHETPKMMVWLPPDRDRIDTKINGTRVVLLPDQLGSCPIEIGNALKERYGVREVVDHPQTKAPLPGSITVEPLVKRLINRLKSPKNRQRYV